MESNRTRQISPSNKTKDPPMTFEKPQYQARCDQRVRSRSPSRKTVLSSSLTRRDFLALSTALSVSPLVFSSPDYAKDTTMTTATEEAVVAQTAGNNSIRPFTYRATDEELNDLRRRVAATRLPDKEPVSDFSQGVKLATV